MAFHRNTAASESGAPIASAGATEATHGTADTALLAVLSNAAARSILCAADEPLTAKEVASECGLALSTAYRNLERLGNTPLVAETTRPQENGKHPQQYQRRFDSIRIRVSPAGSFHVEVIPRGVD